MEIKFSDRDVFFVDKIFYFFEILPHQNTLVFSIMVRRRYVLFLERRNFIKHKLKIGVSKNSPKSSVVTYKKVSPEVKVKDLIGESNKVTMIVPRGSVKSVTIEETKEANESMKS